MRSDDRFAEMESIRSKYGLASRSLSVAYVVHSIHSVDPAKDPKTFSTASMNTCGMSVVLGLTAIVQFLAIATNGQSLKNKPRGLLLAEVINLSGENHDATITMAGDRISIHDGSQHL